MKDGIEKIYPAYPAACDPAYSINDLLEELYSERFINHREHRVKKEEKLALLLLCVLGGLGGKNSSKTA